VIKTTDKHWQIKTFSQLTKKQLYDLLKLRINVFVVEQQCAYGDLDDKDHDDDVLHVFNYDGDKIVSYLRILPLGIKYQDAVSIGRVIVAQAYRHKGLGHTLINQGIKLCQQIFPNTNIKISAQTYLIDFYQKHDFICQGERYLEDGIPHIDMLYPLPFKVHDFSGR
jgi:ElaA protein